jgi:DNA-binding NarL/FixJ family response regulator
MPGTLVVSRAVILFPHVKPKLEELGFTNITLTGVRKDGLNMLINDVKPDLLIMGSGFYTAGTPYMIGELHKLFPDLNIAVVSVFNYPLRRAPWFIWHGANSYIDLWDKGLDEFYRGLKIVSNGGNYISPKTERVIKDQVVYPDTDNTITKRMQECLIMLCCGFDPEQIGEELHITRKTVYNHIGFLYKAFHAGNREEMIAIAWELELITREDIMFYRKQDYDIPLPEWAEVNKKTMDKYRLIMRN